MSEETEIRRGQYAQNEGEIVLRDHVYDGIQEYDQKLPNWWLAIFIAAHVFFVGYWFAYYQLGWFATDQAQVEMAMNEVRAEKNRILEEMLASLDDQILIEKWATDPDVVAAGQTSYLTNCTACHGADLTATMALADGTTGPLSGLSLKDGEWKYGASPMAIFKLINEGTPPEEPGHNGAKMQPWGINMPPKQIAEITAYLISENPDDF